MWGFVYTIITLSYAKMTEKAQDGRWGGGEKGQNENILLQLEKTKQKKSKDLLAIDIL